MGLFNTVETRVSCPCGNEENLEVQFRYGDVYQHHYQVGDVIQWDPKTPSTNVGAPGHSKVVVEGFKLCPVCEAELEFEIWLEKDKIVAVKPATGVYDFFENQDFIVIEE